MGESHDGTTPDVPLPRRPSRAGEGQIAQARGRLYGPAGGHEEGTDGASAGAGRVMVGIEARERSAALARDAVSGPAGRRDLVPARGGDPVRPHARAAPGPSTEVDDAPAATPSPVPSGPDVPPEEPDPDGDGRSGSAAPRIRRGRQVLLAVGTASLVLAAGVTAGALLGASRPPSTAEPGPVLAAPRPTLLGRVLDVRDGRTLSVDVAGRTVDVSVLGLDTPVPGPPGTPPPCGASAATALAADTLTGQEVTLVPDPSVAEFDARGRRQAHVVLRTQQSYTDLALLKGVGRADTSQDFWYRDVFAREEATARAAGDGIWGAPCRAAR